MTPATLPAFVPVTFQVDGAFGPTSVALVLLPPIVWMLTNPPVPVAVPAASLNVTGVV